MGKFRKKYGYCNMKNHEKNDFCIKEKAEKGATKINRNFLCKDLFISKRKDKNMTERYSLYMVRSKENMTNL